MMSRQNFFRECVECSLVNVRAKRSQDNKPFRVMEEACPDRFSRGCPLEPAVASQSLEDRSISSLAVAFEATSAPLIPARPFGLGLRFDEAPLVTPSKVSRQRYQAQPRNGRSLAYRKPMSKRPSPRLKPLVETTKIGSIAQRRKREKASQHIEKPK